MPKVSPLGSAARRAAEYDRQTKEIEEAVFSRIGAKHLHHQDIADVLCKTRSAVSYSLKNIDSMRLSDFRKMCDYLDLEITIKKRD